MHKYIIAVLNSEFLTLLVCQLDFIYDIKNERRNYRY